MAIQEHSKALWRESSGSGGVLAAVPMFLRKDGADVVFSLVAPAQFAFIDLEGAGDYTLVDLTPVYLVADGADFTIDQVGPGAAILVDDGAGGVQLSADLTLTPIADLYYDTAGDLVVVLRARDRLEAALVGDNVQLY